MALTRTKAPAEPARPGEYSVRAYRKEDLADVTAAEYAAYLPPETLSTLHSESGQAAAHDACYPPFFFVQAGTVFGGGFLVAESRAPAGGARGGVVGYVLAVVSGDDPKLGWIMSLAVHPDHQRRGVGDALMTRAEEYLAKQDCTRASLTVDPRNGAAFALYTKRGYGGREELPRYFGEGGDRVQLFLDLPQPLVE